MEDAIVSWEPGERGNGRGRVHLPPTEHLPDDAPHMMALSSLGLEVQDTDTWMIAGHRSAEDAHHGGWPRVSSRPTPATGMEWGGQHTGARALR